MTRRCDLKFFEVTHPKSTVGDSLNLPRHTRADTCSLQCLVYSDIITSRFASATYNRQSFRKEDDQSTAEGASLSKTSC